MAAGMGILYVLKGTMNAERYIKVLEQHMLPFRRRLFQGWPCVFQQNKAKPHTAAITTARLCVRRVHLLNWPACNSDLSTIENIWHIIKRKMLNSLAAGKPISGKNGTRFQHQNSRNSCPDVFKLV